MMLDYFEYHWLSNMMISRFFSSITDTKMISASTLAVFLHTLVNMTEYLYVSEMFVQCQKLTSSCFNFDAPQMLTGNAPVLTAGPWALFYGGDHLLPKLSKVLSCST